MQISIAVISPEEFTFSFDGGYTSTVRCTADGWRCTMLGADHTGFVCGRQVPQYKAVGRMVQLAQNQKAHGEFRA